MIAHLRGNILFKQNHIAVIDVNGVGYEVLAPTSVLDGWALERRFRTHLHRSSRRFLSTFRIFERSTKDNL